MSERVWTCCWSWCFRLFISTMLASALARSLILKVIFVSITSSECEFIASWCVGIVVPSRDIVLATSSQWRQIAKLNCVVTKFLAFLECLKVILIAIAARVSKLCANSVAPVIVEASYPIAARARFRWQETVILLSWNRRSARCSRRRIWVTRCRMSSRCLSSRWPIIAQFTSLIAFALWIKSIIISTAAAIIELTTSLDFRIEIPQRRIILTVANVSR